MAVANVGFLIDRLGADCAPLQFLRELTQNSLEAIDRARTGRGKNGSITSRVVWDVDWSRLELVPGSPPKLCVADDGDGMTGPEMVRYVNQLSASIGKQSLRGNYGVGAKIAAATRSRAGLIYISWKDGGGAMVHLWRDPTTGQYGLRQFQQPGGQWAYWTPVDDKMKPSIIKEHGTLVVLLGDNEKIATMNAPEGAVTPSRWIAKYLNTRYFRFPTNIDVRAREGWDRPRSDKDHNLLRRITGQHEYLEGHAESSGVVELSDAAA